LEVSLRVLNAYTIHHTPPAPADEAYLRELTADTTTPTDELACQIIQTELANLQAKNKALVDDTEAISKKNHGCAA
jgi:hypothetical protein